MFKRYYIIEIHVNISTVGGGSHKLLVDYLDGNTNLLYYNTKKKQVIFRNYKKKKERKEKKNATRVNEGIYRKDLHNYII